MPISHVLLPVGRMTILSGLIVLGGCAGRIDRSYPFQSPARGAPVRPLSDHYVWARNDGQRMAGNPVLLRQGQKDQAECRHEAASGTGLSQTVFAACMQRRGYRVRLAR